jgi:TRAP-type C4-dicarboxylate transport system substrate-binding protein
MHAVNGASRPPSRIPRRSLLAAAALAAPFLPRLARAAAEVTWRIAHSAPTDFPLHLRLVEAAATIATRSEGKMAVEVHPNSELGSPMGLLGQLRAGTLDVVPLTSQTLARDLPIAALTTPGFAFTGPDQLWSALDGGVGAYIRSQLKDRLGLMPMDRCWDFGFHQVTTNGKVIKTAADLAGLRLRTPPEAEYIALFQTLKAVPMPVPVTLLRSVLQAHDVDAQESVLPLVEAANLFQVQSVCALTNHLWDGDWICVSGKSWSRLPAKLQDIVAAALNESGLHQRQDIADANTKVRKDMEAAGMTFNAVDTPSFRSALRQAGYYDVWRKKMGDDGWDALEKYTGQLAR